MKCSVIVCVSDAEVLERCLLQSIRATRAGHDVEIIPIINNNNRYSASNALNIGIDVARSDILVFAHQDVRLLDDWFDILADRVAALPENWGVFGSAGISLEFGREDIGKWGGALKASTVAVGTVWDSDEALQFPPYWDGIKALSTVHAVDECLLVLNRRIGLRFDSAFTGFHFYGVDLCLQARAAGYTVHAAHLPIIHYGKYSASFVGDKKYWVYLRLLYSKWRMRFPELLGTHMHWAKDELTSYISLDLESPDGMPLRIRAMGVGRMRLTTDHRQGIVS